MKSFIGLSVIAFSNGVLSRSVTAEEWDHLRLLNELRADGYTCPDGTVYPANPTPLEWDCGLWRAGQLHSQDMADLNYFSHTGNDGSSPWDRAGAQGVSANAENIAAGRADAVTTLEQWKTSNGHCKNMMNASHKSLGVGYGYNQAATYDHYWTQMLSYSAVPAGQNTQTSCHLEPTLKPTPEPTVPSTPYPTSASGSMMHDEELEFFRLVNEARASGVADCHGVQKPAAAHTLEWNCGLWRAAHGHSLDMATNNFWSRTGSDGSSHGDRAEREGAEFGCEGFMIAGSSTAQAAFERFQSLTCSYFMMEAKYYSFAVGFASNPNAAYKHYWTIMLGKTPIGDDMKTCYADSPTPEPTLAPTGTPTSEPTLAPTDAPTIAPTTESVVESCKDLTEKNPCKANNECLWKKKCKDKATVCPGQKEKKCKKFGCIWDGACSWSS